MPFYEYECRACGEQTEVLQKISDKPLRKCPGCGKNSLVKLVSAPIFRLKGSGWYETDFKSEQDKKRNLAGDPAETKADSKVDAKADAKSDGKSESKTEAKADASTSAKSDAKPAAEGGSTRSRKAKSTRAAAKPRKPK